jgi:glycosyltransferase involved in cell wall biosynthesis
MAAALTRLLDNAELRRTLGSAGVQRARQEFSLDTMVSRTLELYRSLMKAQ